MAPSRVELAVELYTGVLVAPQIIALIDSNADEAISQIEAQAYVDLFLQDVTFEVDGQPAAIRTESFEMPALLDLRAGVGVIRLNLYAMLPNNRRDGHQMFYRNNHLPEIGIYLVNALSENPQWIQIHRQDKDVFQQSVRLDYTISPDAPLSYDATDGWLVAENPNKVSEGQQQLTNYLYEPNLSPLLALLILTLAVVLGGLHALTPGHGKTLVAAYLIGSRGTVSHAMLLGGIVTFTHTISVIVIGLLALLASQFIVPNVLAPGLEIFSGLLVIFLGVQLLWARWRVYKQSPDFLARNEHDHAHAHKYGLPHHHHHHHEPAMTTKTEVRLSDLLTLGVSGGLIPCPEALGIMLIAIGLNRVLLGLGLVIAFSFGLAAVLIVIGILLVRAKAILERFSRAGQRWQTMLPMASAALVTLLGLGILLKGVLSL